MEKIQTFFNKIIYDSSLTILTVMSWFNWLRSLFYPNKILFQKKYQGEKIVLIALYEKGFLRNDIKNLLKLARSKNLYVIGVNTRKLFDKKAAEDFFDCYIERYNFGRDFGSYKVGFNYIFKQKYHKQCPRLLMLNDSVYFESTRSEKFLDQLMNTQIEILGATENYEVEYHLGSFCISLAGRILRHKKFMRYWKNFRNSDVRPVVIKRGEMALSRCLERLAISTGNFCALYNTSVMARTLKQNDNFLDVALKTIRRSNRVDWYKIDAQKLWAEFVAQYYFSNMDINLKKNKNKIKIKLDNLVLYCTTFNLENVKTFFETQLKIHDEQLFDNMIQFVHARLVRLFREGSQIHQNSALLLYMGLPLIKLDGFYRGPFSEEDVLIICQQLNFEEAMDLQKLLFSKSFGGDALFGWKRYLFSRGMI